MRIDDKRKPASPEGKRRSAFNSVTHAAYLQEFILPGEELLQFQLLMDTHLGTLGNPPPQSKKPSSSKSTLWRLRRQAPAESNLFNIQIRGMQRMVYSDFAIPAPVAPEPPNIQPQPDLELQNEPVETNLTEDHDPTTQPTENEIVEKQPVEIKLLGSITLHLPLTTETHVHNPHSILICRAPSHRQVNRTCSQDGLRYYRKSP